MSEHTSPRPTQRRPSSRAVALAIGSTLLALAAESIVVATSQQPMSPDPEVSRRVSDAAIAIALVAAFVMAWDWFAIARMSLPRVRRLLPRSLALHDWAWVELELWCEQAPSAPLWINDAPPADAQTESLPFEIEPPARQRVRRSYRVRPMRRGDATFGPPTLRTRSPLGLWEFTSPCGEGESVRVYPNFAAIARYGAIALDHHTHQVGIRLQQRRGSGLEFHQLREFREGDALRQIDWKATSRRQQLTSREYQDERDQRVIFLLDCSRRMRAKDDDLSHFDHALNAMILLSHVALKAGDAVGFMSFGEETRWLPANKGVSTVNRILDSVYDLESSTRNSDFSGAAEDLSSRLSRRALVILLTNVRDEDVEDLVPGVRLLSRRNLVLVANLREEKIDHVAREEIRDFSGALRSFAAWHHRLERRRVQESLEQSHTLSLDTTPSQLPAQLINRYYAIKRSGEL